MRTSNTVGIIQLVGKSAILKGTLSLADSFTKIHRISCFEFMNKPVTNENDKILFVGYKSGLIAMYNYENSQFLNEYNKIFDEK